MQIDKKVIEIWRFEFSMSKIGISVFHKLVTDALADTEGRILGRFHSNFFFKRVKCLSILAQKKTANINNKLRDKMPKTRELSDFERGEIVGLSKGNHSVRDISKILQISKSTVQDVIKKYNDEGMVSTASRSGRPPILSDQDRRQLVRLTKGNRQATLEQLTEEFNKSLTVSASVQTIRRALHIQGYYGRTAKKKPFVSEINRKKRRFWCLARRNWSDEWNKVIFSDESRFEIFDNDSHKWVWRRANEKYEKDCLKPTVQKSDGIMLWGCFCKDQLGPLVLVDGRITADRYIRLLRQHLLPFLNTLGHDTYLFQDDNAPVHTARRTKEWKERNLGDSTLPWPAQSPDLNPIEHLWDVLERRVRLRNPKTKNKVQLFDALQEEWRNLAPETYAKLVHSMPRRVDAVIRANGNPTRY
jgi:transposase